MYEYKVRRVGGLEDQQVQDKLKEWGSQGWRAVWFWPQESGALGNVVDLLIVFERPVARAGTEYL